MDSLGLVDLALALEEKTGCPVADGDLRLDMTLADIRTMLQQPGPSGATAGVLRNGATPLWPYGWGRAFRTLGLPFHLIYRFGVTKTHVLGGEHLKAIGPRVIIAGTHHSFADIHLVQHGLAATRLLWSREKACRCCQRGQSCRHWSRCLDWGARLRYIPAQPDGRARCELARTCQAHAAGQRRAHVSAGHPL